VSNKTAVSTAAILTGTAPWRSKIATTAIVAMLELWQLSSSDQFYSWSVL